MLILQVRLLVRPEKWHISQVEFRDSNASRGRTSTMGVLCFQTGHFGRISSTRYFTVFQSLGGHTSAKRVSHKPDFCQMHCFKQRHLRFLLCPQIPMCTLPHLGFSTLGTRPRMGKEWLKMDVGLFKLIGKQWPQKGFSHFRYSWTSFP